VTRFSEGREAVQDDFRLGQPTIMKTDKNVKEEWQLLHSD
jgi:hypothetical protein